MRAVIYARYSSNNQTEMSITGQIKVNTEYAQRNNIEIVDTYIDRAISGKKENRPAFQKMIQDSKKKLFDAVLVYKLDRFARDRYVSAIYRRELKKNHVDLISTTEDVNEDTPVNVVMQSVLEGLAEFYSLNLSQNVKRGLLLLQQEGKYTGGYVPLGYTIDENKNYQIDPIAANYVKQVYEMYLNGSTLTGIAEYLTKNGILSPAGKEYDKRSISRMIRCEKYIGVYKTNEVFLENAVPAIIDKDTFILANEKLGHTKKHKEKKDMGAYILTDKLFCGSCGDRLVGYAGTSSTKKEYQYYKCNGCDKKAVRKDKLESFIVDQTIQNLCNEDVIAEIAKQVYEAYKKECEDDSCLKNLEKQLSNINKSLANIMKAIEHGIFNETTQERIKELETEKHQILSEIEREKVKGPEITQDLLEFFLFDMLSSADPTRIIDTFIQKVTIHPDTIEIIYNCTNVYSKVRLSANWWGSLQVGRTNIKIYPNLTFALTIPNILNIKY